MSPSLCPFVTVVFIDTKTLSTTGTDTLLVDPQSTNTGQVSVPVNDVPADPTHAVEVGGDLVDVVTLPHTRM